MGQAQRWFTFRLLDDATEPTPDGEEFVDWKLVDREWLTGQIVEFRRAVYQRVLGG
jgi:hypothetical protein